MKFSINYSPTAAQLLQQGEIEVEYFKCPDWPDLIAEARQYRPATVHFPLTAGNGSIEHIQPEALELINRLSAETDTYYINLHLAAPRKDYPEIAVDAPGAADVARMTAQMHADVEAAIKYFGAERVIVENIPYHAGKGDQICTAADPHLIRQIVTEAGCGFLLDISHAKIAAHYLGIDAHEYIEALPVQALREMHVTGIQMLDGRLHDHLALQPADWAELDWVLGRIRSGDWGVPWMTAFEYGGVGNFFVNHCDPHVIASQVPELYRRISAVPALSPH